MRIAPTLAEVDSVKNDVLSCFVACDIDGMCKAYAVVDASRYDMGTARPIEVGSWWVEFLSRDEVVFQGAKNPGDILSIRRAEHVLVAVAGGEVEVATEEYVKTLKRERNRRKEEQEQARQQQEQVWKREQARQKQRINQEQALQKQKFTITIAQKVTDRGKRLEQDQNKLARFPELKNFRQALDYELDTQKILVAQLNAERDIYKLALDVERADESELRNLKLMRNQAEHLVQKQLEAKIQKDKEAIRAEKEKERDQKKEAENQAQREKEAQLAQTSSGCGCVLLIVAFGLGVISVSRFSVLLLQSVALLFHKAL